jgi:O-methyltransferase involved in polyketide biosynthesis
LLLMMSLLLPLAAVGSFSLQWLLEFPLLGIPGIVRFIDVRTQWFDDSVNAAIRDGIKQVRGGGGQQVFLG